MSRCHSSVRTVVGSEVPAHDPLESRAFERRTVRERPYSPPVHKDARGGSRVAYCQNSSRHVTRLARLAYEIAIELSSAHDRGDADARGGNAPTLRGTGRGLATALPLAFTA